MDQGAKHFQLFPTGEKRFMPNAHFKHLIPESKQWIHTPLPLTKCKANNIATKVDIQKGEIKTPQFWIHVSKAEATG